MLKNTVSGGTQWERSFIHDVVIIFESGFVPLKGMEFKTVSQRRQGGKVRERKTGRKEGWKGCVSASTSRCWTLIRYVIIYLDA